MDMNDVVEIASWLKTSSNKVYVSNACNLRAGIIREERTNKYPYKFNLNSGALIVVADERCEYLFVPNNSGEISWRSMYFMPRISMEEIK